MFSEPQKQMNKRENARRERVILCFKFCFQTPLLLTTISGSLNDLKNYNCAISKSIKRFYSEKKKKTIVKELKLQNDTKHI